MNGLPKKGKRFSAKGFTIDLQDKWSLYKQMASTLNKRKSIFL